MKFNAQEKLFDIEWFEGPMLSLFRDKEGDLFIYKWVDVNKDSQTWLVFRTSPDLIAAYIQRVISERALVLLAADKTWYLTDINSALEFSNERKITAQILRQSFLPLSDTFFKTDNCPEPEKIQAFIAEEMTTV